MGVHPRDYSHLELVTLGDIAKGDGQGGKTPEALGAHHTDLGLESRLIAVAAEPHIEHSARADDS